MTSTAFAKPHTLPGVAVAVAVASAALLIAHLIGPLVSPIVVGICLGLGIGNLFTLPRATKPGLDLTARRALRLGIVLLGAKLSMGDVAGIGVTGLGVVVLSISTAFVIVGLTTRVVGVAPRLGILLAFGTAICGNSAIMASAPILGADEEEIGVAVGTVTLFGLAALLAFPMIARLVDMPDAVFGFWAGISINDTSQVVAAGAAFSEDALRIATIVKMVRNTLMAPVLLILYFWARRHLADTQSSPATIGAARGAFPLFVLGFLALATLRSFGIIDSQSARLLTVVSTAFLTAALGAVGASIRFDTLRMIGSRPIILGLILSAMLALIGVALAQVVG